MSPRTFASRCPLCRAPATDGVEARDGILWRTFLCHARPDPSEERHEPIALASSLGVDLADVADDCPPGSVFHRLGDAPSTVADGPAAEPDPFPFDVLSEAALLALPEPEPLVSQTFNRGALVMLAGAPKSGKSFVALDLACCIATGTPWHGRDVASGRVLYIAGEGVEGMRSRLPAWRHHHGIAEPIPDDRLAIVAGAPALDNPAHMAHLGALSADYDLVVVDTLARSSGALDENRTADANQMVTALDGLRSRMARGSILVVHHTGKASGASPRGSSAFTGAVDVLYLATTPRPDSDITALSRTLNKDGPTEDGLTFLRVPSLDSIVLALESEVDAGPTEVMPDLLPEDLTAAWRVLWLTFGDGLGKGQTFTQTQAVTAMREHLDISRTTGQRRLTALGSFDVVVNVGTVKAPRFALDREAAIAEGFPIPNRIPDGAAAYLGDVDSTASTTSQETAA